MVETKKIDRRVKKTKKQLKKALTTLLQIKPIQKIKVNELAELIDINRGTFYQHYTDIYKLLEEIENDTLQDFKSFIDEAKNKASDHDNYEITQLHFENFLVTFLTYIQDNKETIKALFGPYGDRSFFLKVQDLIKEQWLNDHLNHKGNITDQQFHYLFAYFAAGSVEVIRIWLQSETNDSPEDIAKLIESINRYGLNGILK